MQQDALLFQTLRQASYAALFQGVRVQPLLEGFQTPLLPTPLSWEEQYGEWAAWELTANVVPNWGSYYLPATAKRLSDVYYQFLLALSSAESDVSQAIMDYSNPAYQSELTDDNNLTLACLNWDLSPSLSDSVHELKKGKTPFTITFDYTDLSSVISNPADAESVGSTAFISIDSSPACSVQPDESFHFSLSSDAFLPVQFTPGPWYHQSVVDAYRNGPFNPNSPYGQGEAQFWGENGTFSKLTQTVYAIYRPVIEMTVGKDALHSLQQAVKPSSILTIGHLPFYTDDLIFTDKDKGTFKVKSKMDRIYLFAVYAQILGT